jgi:hypothetical protein
MKYEYAKEWVASLYDADTDIATPKAISITTGAKKAHVRITVKTTGTAVITLAKALVIGTGGGASAGTAVTAYAKDQASTLTPLTVVKQDYGLGSSGQSAGTTIYNDISLSTEESEISFKLAASTAYGLVITTIADNNAISVAIEIAEV